MSVYIVVADFYNDICGVFSTLDKAIKYIDNNINGMYTKEDFEIWEMKLDESHRPYSKTWQDITPYGAKSE